MYSMIDQSTIYEFSTVPVATVVATVQSQKAKVETITEVVGRLDALSARAEANRPWSAVYDVLTEKETQHGSTSPTTGNFGPRWSTNFFTTQKTTNLRMECSHECARKACVRVPHAQDLIYEALNDWRRS